MKWAGWILVVVLLLGQRWLAALPQARPASPVRVVVVTGGHAYDASFDSLFEGHADISAMVYPRDVAYTRDLRRIADVLVLYDLSREITENEQKVLRDFLESGKGLVVLHHAIADYNSWAWWYQEVVGGKFLLKEEGSVAASTATVNQEVVARPVAEHPITSGIGPLNLSDETYKGMWISPKVRALLRTDNPRSDQIIAWISPYEKSGVVVIQPGHDRKSHTHPGYRALVRNAILWSVGRLTDDRRR